jgi:hypothetical protein
MCLALPDVDEIGNGSPSQCDFVWSSDGWVPVTAAKVGDLRDIDDTVDSGVPGCALCRRGLQRVYCSADAGG